jgi:hypothetical protein
VFAKIQSIQYSLVAGLYEHRNNLPGCIKGEDFLDRLNDFLNWILVHELASIVKFPFTTHLHRALSCSDRSRHIPDALDSDHGWDTG